MNRRRRREVASAIFWGLVLFWSVYGIVWLSTPGPPS